MPTRNNTDAAELMPKRDDRLPRPARISPDLTATDATTSTAPAITITHSKTPQMDRVEYRITPVAMRARPTMTAFFKYSFMFILSTAESRSNDTSRTDRRALKIYRR